MTEKGNLRGYYIFCLIVLLIAIVNVSWADTIPREAQKHMNRGMAAVEVAESQSDYEDAISEFEQAANIAPHWAAPYFNLGYVLKETGKYQESIDNYKKYLKLAPDAPDKEQVLTEIDQIEYKLEKVTKAAKIKSWLEGEWVMYTKLQGEAAAWPITFTVNENSIIAYLPTTRSMGYVDKATDYETISVKRNGDKILFSVALKAVYTEPGISELLQTVNAEYELNQISFNEMKGTHKFSSKKFNSDGSIWSNKNGTEEAYFSKQKHSDNFFIRSLMK